MGTIVCEKVRNVFVFSSAATLWTLLNAGAKGSTWEAMPVSPWLLD